MQNDIQQSSQANQIDAIDMIDNVDEVDAADMLDVIHLKKTETLEDLASLDKDVRAIALQAKKASQRMVKINPADKQSFLIRLAQRLDQSQERILAANQKDLLQYLKQGKTTDYLYDRLKLDIKTIEKMSESVRQVAQLKEYIGEIYDVNVRPNGLKIGKMRAPIGVLAIIYEARPNVTIEAAVLSFKTSNAVILRGGKEAWHSNQILIQILQETLAEFKIDPNCIQTLPDASRTAFDLLLKHHDLIDLVIPRGGKGLIEHLLKTTRIPMIKHLDGVCHTYVDAFADLTQASDIAYNAKCQRYSTCNTMETLLIHEKVVNDLLKTLLPKYESQKVELRVEDDLYQKLKMLQYPFLQKAIENDWSSEYLAPILAIKIVKNLDEAILHINQYGSKHTDAIITESYSNALQFMQEVDSGSVMVNASTRFADGFEYGLGAEIGISNDKLHARGPVGLAGLCSEKYIVLGQGQVRE
jgi:glutamate-5-semialdehyde dehydrogenase